MVYRLSDNQITDLTRGRVVYVKTENINPFAPMLKLMGDVEKSGCRIVKWKMTERYAAIIAEYTSHPRMPQTIDIIFEGLKSGKTPMFGAKVEVT